MDLKNKIRELIEIENAIVGFASIDRFNNNIQRKELYISFHSLFRSF